MIDTMATVCCAGVVSWSASSPSRVQTCYASSKLDLVRGICLMDFCNPSEGSKVVLPYHPCVRHHRHGSSLIPSKLCLMPLYCKHNWTPNSHPTFAELARVDEGVGMRHVWKKLGGTIKPVTKTQNSKAIAVWPCMRCREGLDQRQILVRRRWTTLRQ